MASPGAFRPRSVRCFETIFVVEGAGEFPIDMLRYDSAFPLTATEAFIAQQGTLPRRVVLQSRRLTDDPPSCDRWASARWPVLGVYSERSEAELVANEGKTTSSSRRARARVDHEGP